MRKLISIHPNKRVECRWSCERAVYLRFIEGDTKITLCLNDERTDELVDILTKHKHRQAIKKNLTTQPSDVILKQAVGILKMARQTFDACCDEQDARRLMDYLDHVAPSMLDDIDTFFEDNQL